MPKNNIRCTFCGASFTTSKNLERHTLNLHYILPKKCVCGEIFYREIELFCHRQHCDVYNGKK